MATFFAGLSHVLHSRGVQVVWETPATSLIPLYSPVHRAMAGMSATSATTPMGAFGGSSVKMLHLFGTSRALSKMTAPVPKHSEPLEKRPSVVDRLAQSAAYTTEFCNYFLDAHFAG